ncbi:hypothetical protein [Asticcacaulis excentricus]|jgi:hypothetical protein|uniref:hypothetical protein n=1 Tax=Asticcacaulis excentricus TaxID=78587 RepID=UPI000F820976|nr:hypothetical protein [Asticcacaulis excentricus]
MVSQTRPLRRNEASEYLFQTHGIKRVPATLAKLATLGGGPLFRKANRTPLYEVSELDAWAASITTGPKRSTSDIGAEG